MVSSVIRTALASLLLSLAILAALPVRAFARSGGRKGEHEV